MNPLEVAVAVTRDGLRLPTEGIPTDLADMMSCT